MIKDTYYSSKSLSFFLINADVKIIGEQIDHIEYEIKETANITVSKDSNGLFFTQKSLSPFMNVLTGMGTELVVYVPENMILENLTIESKNSGDFLIDNIRTLSYEQHSLSGDINIRNCHMDKLYIKTENGDIDMKTIDVDDIYIATDSGDIEIENADGRIINIATNSGDVEIENLDAINVFIRTVSGDIDVEVDGIMEDYHISTNTITVFEEFNVDKKRILDLSTVSGEIDYVFLD